MRVKLPNSNGSGVLCLGLVLVLLLPSIGFASSPLYGDESYRLPDAHISPVSTPSLSRVEDLTTEVSQGVLYINGTADTDGEIMLLDGGEELARGLVENGRFSLSMLASSYCGNAVLSSRNGAYSFALDISPSMNVPKPSEPVTHDDPGEPPIPHTLYGYTWNASGGLAPLTLLVTNLDTGDNITIVSCENGTYDIPLDQFTVYNTSHSFHVLANDTNNWGENTTMLEDSFGTMFNVTLYNGPIVSNPWPNNTTVADPHHPVNVTILSIKYPVNVSSIVFEVESTKYTVDGENLTYDVATGNLVFNTTNAGITWQEGNNIIALWSANDTLGNPGENVPYVWNFTLLSAMVEKAPDIRVHKQGNDLNITWAAVENATYYNIYLSNEVDGTGFDWSTPHATIDTLYYVHEGANVDTNNYSYIVRGANLAGEGPASNIGWKLRKLLVRNDDTTSFNWIALPYNSDLSSAQDLINDIGATNVHYAARWVVPTQSLQNKPPVGGFNWPITPGEGLLLNMRETVYHTIVGSYNASTTVDIILNAGTTSFSWIALPYHSNLLFAQDLINDIGAANVHYAARWVVPTQSLQNKPPVGGFNWPITPGEALFINARDLVLEYDLGSVYNP